MKNDLPPLATENEVDHLERLTSLVARLVPRADVLPHRRMGAEVQIVVQVSEGLSAVLDPVRQRLEREEAVALGAKLIREWQVVDHKEVWLVAVHHKWVGALADLLERETLYPLLISRYASSTLADCAPELVQAGYDVDVRDDRQRRHKDDPVSMILATERQLDAIEAALARRRAESAKSPWRAVEEMSYSSAGPTMLAEAVRKARLVPLERAR